MTSRIHLTDREIERFLRARSAAPDIGLFEEIMAATRAIPQARPRWRLAPQSPRLTILWAALLLTALLVGATLAGAGLLRLPWPTDRDQTNLLLPWQPLPTATPRPTPAARPTTWSGPVRSDAAGLPVLSITQAGEDPPSATSDPIDAAEGWVDITRVGGGDSGWTLTIASPPPSAEGLDPEETVISYGVVLETSGDGVPDYEIGINNDAPTAGEFRVWVTDLGAQQTEERVGPPYGFPVDFAHPDEVGLLEEGGTSVHLFFTRISPAGLRTAPKQFYAWASMTVRGEVVAWDYAPDGAWLQSLLPDGWSGPVRWDAVQMPTFAMGRNEAGTQRRMIDAPDADEEWVDIRRVVVQNVPEPSWRIELEAPPPPADGLDPAETAISYGLVFETTGDGVPDYEVGISSDAPTPGDFRVWVTDIARRQIREQVGPPYGLPVRFAHPDDHQPGDIPELRAAAEFTFVPGSQPPGLSGETLFYAWASAAVGGRVVAWDYAADAAWLHPYPGG